MNEKQEIVTIQIGNFSNFIGSHYWNIQEENYQYCKREGSQYEIEPSMLFRSNNTTNENDIKFTPRLLLFDFKNNFGAMNSEGRVYKSSSATPTNSEFNNSQNVTKILKNSSGKPIDRSNNSVDNSKVDFEYWSDYLNIDYNGRGLIAIPDSLLLTTSSGSSINSGSSSESNEWNNLLYEDGLEFFESNYELMDQYQDSLRRIIEECDSFSGFQCFIDSDGIWGGISTSVLLHLQDEYSSRVVSVYSSSQYSESINSKNEASIDERIYNNTKLYQSLVGSRESSDNLASLFIPISSQNWWSSTTSFGSNILKTKYQTSAEIAASIDTATLYYRSNYQNQNLSSFVNHLSSTSHRRISILSSSFPLDTKLMGFEFKSNQNEPKYPHEPLYRNEIMNYLSPIDLNSNISNITPLNEIVSIRGLNLFSDIYKVKESDLLQLENDYNIISNLFKNYLVNSYINNNKSVLNRSICNINQPFIMKKNHFPVLSNNNNSNSNNNGNNNNINNNSNNNNNNSINENPNTIITHLQNSNLISQYLKKLSLGFKEITETRKLKRLIVDKDSFHETVEDLNNLIDSYSE